MGSGLGPSIANDSKQLLHFVEVAMESKYYKEDSDADKENAVF